MMEPGRVATDVLSELPPVAETMLVTLWARAQESAQAQPMFEDARARAILEALPYDFSRWKNARDSQVGLSQRSQLIDRWVREFLHVHPKATILELGTGLDTRFERIDNGTVRWIDLDVPGVMQLRKHFVDGHARRPQWKTSPDSFDWLDQLNEQTPTEVPMLLLAEGVLMYWRAEQVDDFFKRVREIARPITLLLDVVSPMYVRFSHWHDVLRHLRARMTWGISNPSQWQRWLPGVQIERDARFVDFPLRARKRFSWPFWLLTVCPPFRSMYRILQLELGQENNGERKR